MDYHGEMSRFRGAVEHRLFQAVLAVLGACERSSSSPPAPAPADATGVAPVVTSRDAAVAERMGDASALCAAYRKRARVDPSRARQGEPPMAGYSIVDHAEWDASRWVARCTIVHERTPGMVVVQYSPHWCPQGGGTAPDPTSIEVSGQKLLVEHVSLRADGSLAESDLVWAAFGHVERPEQNCGRRFAGLALGPRERDEGAEPGAQLAAMAELEIASIPAFDRLARELVTWGAPEHLVQGAWQAMRDEQRHARMMTSLARRYGHAPREVAVPALPCRSLAAVASENAIEGCVREAYGALVATFQAARATPALRSSFHEIAEDERRHAALADEVHGWALAQLAPTIGEMIEQGRELAEMELRASLARVEGCAELGLPGSREAVALCDAYFA